MITWNLLLSKHFTCVYVRACVCVKPSIHLFIWGGCLFLVCFGPLPRGLVLGIKSFWPVMILNI